MAIIFADSYEVPNDDPSPSDQFFTALFGETAKGIRSGFEDAKDERRFQSSLALAHRRMQMESDKEARDAEMDQKRLALQGEHYGAMERKDQERTDIYRQAQDRADKALAAETESGNAFGEASGLMSDLDKAEKHGNPLEVQGIEEKLRKARTMIRDPKHIEAFNRMTNTVLERKLKEQEAAQETEQRESLAQQFEGEGMVDADPQAQQILGSLAKGVRAGMDPARAQDAYMKLQQHREAMDNHIAEREALGPMIEGEVQRLAQMAQMDPSRRGDYIAAMQMRQRFMRNPNAKASDVLDAMKAMDDRRMKAQELAQKIMDAQQSFALKQQELGQMGELRAAQTGNYAARAAAQRAEVDLLGGGASSSDPEEALLQEIANEHPDWTADQQVEEAMRRIGGG